MPPRAGKVEAMKAILVLAMCLASWPAFAQENVSGEVFLPACKIAVGAPARTMEDAYKEGFCTGIVATLVRVGDALPDGFRSCAPTTSVLSDALQTVVGFLEANP